MKLGKKITADSRLLTLNLCLSNRGDIAKNFVRYNTLTLLQTRICESWAKSATKSPTSAVKIFFLINDTWNNAWRIGKILSNLLIELHFVIIFSRLERKLMKNTLLSSKINKQKAIYRPQNVPVAMSHFDLLGVVHFTYWQHTLIMDFIENIISNIYSTSWTEWVYTEQHDVKRYTQFVLERNIKTKHSNMQRLIRRAFYKTVLKKNCC